MKLIRLSIIVGLFCAIPICGVIYLGVDRLEKSAPKLREFQEIVSDIPIVSMETEPPSPFDESPIKRRLTNYEGRQLDTIITGRSEEMIHFFAFPHNRNYDYPITQLSSADRAFATSLPLSTAEESAYPVLRMLTDHRGRSKLAVIEGRTQFDLFFHVFEERERHTFPISRLSPRDRDFVFSLPVDR
ncbi:MAG: hypothetical protein KDN20_08800 [Verrucomicrobiae bacterium]|nr:hypothetical protein [Verrucomicrobiae bacterium]